MDSFRLASDADMQRLLEALDDVELSGTYIVTISDKKEKRSVRQLRTYWLLINTIVKSGRGGKHESSGEKLDLKLKFKYVFPILVADDSRFAESWMLWHTNNPSADDATWWVKHNVHIGDLSVEQMSVVIDDIYFEYGSDIDLPHPDSVDY